MPLGDLTPPRRSCRTRPGSSASAPATTGKARARLTRGADRRVADAERCSRRGRGGTTPTWPSTCSAKWSRTCPGRLTARTSKRTLEARSASPGQAGSRSLPLPTGYFVRAVHRRRAGAAVDRSGSAASGQLWSTATDLARLEPSCAIPTRTCCSRQPWRTCTSCTGWPTRRRGRPAAGSGLQLFRRGERVFAGHTGGDARVRVPPLLFPSAGPGRRGRAHNSSGAPTGEPTGLAPRGEGARAPRDRRVAAIRGRRPSSSSSLGSLVVGGPRVRVLRPRRQAAGAPGRVTARGGARRVRAATATVATEPSGAVSAASR